MAVQSIPAIQENNIDRISRLTGEYITASSADTSTILCRAVCFCALFILGIFPGLFYLYSLECKSDTAMRRLREQISSVPILNEATQAAYAKARKDIAVEGLDVSEFPLPKEKQKQDLAVAKAAAEAEEAACVNDLLQISLLSPEEEQKADKALVTALAAVQEAACVNDLLQISLLSPKEEQERDQALAAEAEFCSGLRQFNDPKTIEFLEASHCLPSVAVMVGQNWTQNLQK